MHAATALKEAGYLQTEPTGTYDEEFAAAVTAFQDANSISEENQVGPYTWNALGVQESDFAHYSEAGSGQSIQVGDLSDDGQWRWDGAQWASADQARSTDPGAQPSIQVGELSDDGQWRWDGAQWASAGVDVASYQAAVPAIADASDIEDGDLANSIIEFERGIVHQWKFALDSFDKVMVSASQKEAKPDFASAVLKVFAEKVIGEFGKIHEYAKKVNVFGIVIDVLKGVIGEAERAQNAQKSVALRDFYTTHQTHIADLHRELTAQQALFKAAVQKEANRLLRNDPDSYGMLRMQLMELYQDAAQRHGTATQQALFAELSAEWTSQAVQTSPADVQGEIRIRVLETDLSVIDVVIKAPGGEKLLEQLTGQPGGMDVWNMRVPKVIIYMDPKRGADGYVRLDAANRLANEPVEQDGKYKQRYERLVANGGLAPVTKG